MNRLDAGTWLKQPLKGRNTRARGTPGARDDVTYGALPGRHNILPQNRL